MNSWPTEIGIAMTGPDLSIRVESRLIQPAAGWLETGRTEASAGIHSIAHEALDAAADAAVARWVLGEVQDPLVLSDAPGLEQDWLDGLLATTSAEGSVRVASFQNTLLLRLSAGEVDRIYEKLK